MAAEITTDVVVCAVVPYADDDAVVRLFSDTLGRVGAFARKARTSRRRFPGLSAPALARARLVPRRGTDLYELKELEMASATLAFARDARVLGYAAYLCELVERLVPEAEPAPALHALISAGLHAVAVRGADAVVLRAVELKLLAQLGYLPELMVVDQPGAACVAYDPDTGRLLARAIPGSVPFSADALGAAQALLHANAMDALPTLPQGVLRAASRIFAEHLRRHLASPLKSVAFLRSLEPVEGAPPSR